MTYDDEHIVIYTCRRDIRQNFQKWLVMAAVQFLHAQREVHRNAGLSPVHSPQERTGFNDECHLLQGGTCSSILHVCTPVHISCQFLRKLPLNLLFNQLLYKSTNIRWIGRRCR